ncbi:MAG: UDP-4-amino-4-deoxy-L-arabinose aminotransferase [Deltaproteobacteria bacterium]|nr:UDP-4-amino-4-deoxy-L-arabinose aminotransferase [Deltaproteobacteria bacterium]
MRKDFLPFSRPSISEEDISAVGEVLRSGWITTGPKTAAFERDFREYVGCRHGVALASATAGMHLLLKALGIGPGDEVITPSMTWVSTVNLIVLAGATPVFADIDRDTLMVTPETVAPCFSSRTKAVIPVHFAGASANLSALRKQAAHKGIPLVEDAAHALGTHHRGAHVGAEGTAIFSFHPIKNITTGEGGMFCTDDAETAERISRLKFHGLGVDAYDRETQGRSPQAQVLEPGYKYNMTDVAAILGLRQLRRVNQFIQKRRGLAERYMERLAEVDELLPLAISEDTTQHAWHLFIVRLDIHRAGISRDEFMAELKKKNIGTGLHFRAVHLQKYYREVMGFRQGILPHTEWNSDRICSLPLFPDMTFEDVDDVVEAVKEVLGG